MSHSWNDISVFSRLSLLFLNCSEASKRSLTPWSLPLRSQCDSVMHVPLTQVIVLCNIRFLFIHFSVRSAKVQETFDGWADVCTFDTFTAIDLVSLWISAFISCLSPGERQKFPVKHSRAQPGRASSLHEACPPPLERQFHPPLIYHGWGGEKKASEASFRKSKVFLLLQNSSNPEFRLRFPS